MDLNLPVQAAAVDRSVPLDIHVLSIDQMSFGVLPGDPSPFSAAVDPRLRGCEMFSGYGCLLGNAYFSY